MLVREVLKKNHWLSSRGMNADESWRNGQRDRTKSTEEERENEATRMKE